MQVGDPKYPEITSMCFQLWWEAARKQGVDVSDRFRNDVGVRTEDLERLGHYIASRRVTLGYKSRVELANALDITDRTLADIEHGVRKASAGTYALLENTLGWKPGSIAGILRGREPDVLTQERRTLRDMSTEELMQLQGEVHEEIQDRYKSLRGTPERGRRRNDEPRGLRGARDNPDASAL